MGSEGGIKVKMIKKKIFYFFTILAVAAYMANTCAFALEDGAYVVANSTHYVNPDTGASDDGGDTSIGEGMCRNTVYAYSLYEKRNGKHYLTLRLKMISFIKNIKIKVQSEKGSSTSYKEVSYKAVGENRDENTKDFRFELPSAEILICPEFFVGPMNRDVTFFISLDMEGARADDGAFAAFNSGAGSGKESASGSSLSSSTAAPGGERTASPAHYPDSGIRPSPQRQASGEDAPKKTDEQGTYILPSPVKSPPAPNNTGAPAAYEDGQAGTLGQDGEDEVVGIVEFDAGDKEDSAKSHESADALPLALIGISIACAGTGGYFVYVKKKK